MGFAELEGARPQFDVESLLMRSDNTPAIHWITRCRGGRQPSCAALVKMLGVVEMSSGWCFQAQHVAGAASVLVRGISRWTVA